MMTSPELSFSTSHLLLLHSRSIIFFSTPDPFLSSLSILNSFNPRRSRLSISTLDQSIYIIGLGAVPFFFFELEPQWTGVCNGLAAGVMLAASFDLVQEGQSYGGGGNWVVIGIMSGAIFIWLCKKRLFVAQTDNLERASYVHMPSTSKFLGEWYGSSRKD